MQYEDSIFERKHLALNLTSPADASFETLPAPENKRFYPALNGLRGIAVLMVFLQHYVCHDGFHPAFAWGWLGVFVFFVLSGFLITGILYDTRHTIHRFRNFYARRALRIFPLFYAVLLLVLVTYPIFRWQLFPATFLMPFYLHNFARFIWFDTWLQFRGPFDHFFSTWPHLGSITLLTGHFYSLCVEEQFYLIWPLVLFAGFSRKTLRNMTLIGMVVLLLAKIACVLFVSQRFLDAELLYRCSPFNMDSLLLGAFLALALRGPEAKILERLVWPALYACIFCFIGFTAGYALFYRHFYQPNISGSIMSTAGFLFINVASSVIILAALQPGTALFAFLTLRPLRSLGEISYGFYVFHDLFRLDYLYLMQHFFHVSTKTGTRLDIPVGFLCTLGISYLSFRYFEAPILRYKKNFQTVSP